MEFTVSVDHWAKIKESKKKKKQKKKKKTRTNTLILPESWRSYEGNIDTNHLKSTWNRPKEPRKEPWWTEDRRKNRICSDYSIAKINWDI